MCEIFTAHHGVCGHLLREGKGRLHFIPDKAKINAEFYTSNLLTLLLEDCHNLLQRSFVFQQDGAPAHTAQQTQEWLATNTPDFINKDEWPPNSPDLNPLDYCVWAMLAAYEKHSPKPSTKAELKLCCRPYGIICQKTPSIRQ